ncbi:unnamed protein product [Cylindrotheca closterium]|uniref:Subtilisin n=1 Tax=Cylindrotheca closterium TaxID=2856 RepID=A0AAD2FC51_9STRA|nr:unnamed protein product [Cylindrotheca closterium]
MRGRMVSFNSLWIAALILVTNGVNAEKPEHGSGFKVRHNLNRGQRRRGLQVDYYNSKGSSGKGSSGKGSSKGTPNPTPMPTPPPTAGPTPSPTPPPTPGPTPPPTPPPTVGPTPPPTPPPTAGPTPLPTPPPTTGPTEAVTFQSFIRVEVATSDGMNLNQQAIDNLVTGTVNIYNAEKDNCADPFSRRMTGAEIYSVAPAGRRLNRNISNRKKVTTGNHAKRKLQNLNIFVFLRVNGECNGCRNRPFFFNQVVDRRDLQQCTIVTTGAWLNTFNGAALMGAYGNIISAQSIKDVSEPSSVKSSKVSYIND